MIHKLYSFYELPFDHDVCHLVEHLVIWRYLVELRRAGEQRAYVGSLGGTTSESSIFFETALHTSELTELFEKVLADCTPFPDDTIDLKLSKIEAEMKATATIRDRAELKNQLALCQRRIAGHQTRGDSTAESPLVFDDAPDEFADIAITLEITDVSDIITAAFFCLYPLLIDLVHDACFDEMPIYRTSDCRFISYLDGTTAQQFYSVKKSYDWSTIGERATQYLQAFDPTAHRSELARLVDALKTDPYFTDVPIVFYQKTEIPFDGNDLANAITADNLHQIIQQLTIDVRSAR